MDLSAPFCNNHSTHCSLLFAAAKCNGVQPLLSTARLVSSLSATNGSKSAYLRDPISSSGSVSYNIVLRTHECTPSAKPELRLNQVYSAI